MSRRDSPLYKFLVDALMANKYPGILYWIDRTEGIFCLKCLCKSKRDWKPSHSKIFDDYHKLKPRKSNDRRQRFLVAMKHCPFIEPLEDISTKEEKFYKFRAHGTSSVNTTDEIAAVSSLNQQVEMEEIPTSPIAENRLPAVDATDEIAASSTSDQDVGMQEIAAIWTGGNGPPTGDTSLEDIFCNLPNGNDVGDCLRLMETDNSSLLEALDIAELLQRTNSADVPDGTKDQGLLEIVASTSLYDSADFLRSSPSCGQDLDPLDLFDLPEEEWSYQYKVMEVDGYVPPDYDPVKAFVESLGTPEAATAVVPLAVPEADATQRENVPSMPSTSGESSNGHPSVRVFKLDDNDGIAQSLRGDDVGKKYYMMVLDPKCM